MCLYVLCSIQQYPEIYYYHDNKIIIFITIMKLLSRLSIYLNYLTALVKSLFSNVYCATKNAN